MKLNSVPDRYAIIDSEPEHTLGLQLAPTDNYSIIYVIKKIQYM